MTLLLIQPLSCRTQIDAAKSCVACVAHVVRVLYVRVGCVHVLQFYAQKEPRHSACTRYDLHKGPLHVQYKQLCPSAVTSSSAVWWKPSRGVTVMLPEPRVNYQLTLHTC